MQVLVCALYRQAPGLNRAAHPGRPSFVAGKNRVQPFAFQHLQRFVQAVEQIGVGRVGEIARLVHFDDFVPGPIGLVQLRCFRGFDGTGR